MASRFFFNSERTLNVNLVSLAIRMNESYHCARLVHFQDLVDKTVSICHPMDVYGCLWMTKIGEERMQKSQGAVRSSVRVATRIWGKLSPFATSQLKELVRSHGLSVACGDVVLIDTHWYVTHAGLLRLARHSRCLGITVQTVKEFCDPSVSRYAFKATVHRSRTSMGFVGFGDADPSNVSTLVHGAEMRVAETRAVNRALRKAYGIGICSVEEIGSFNQPATSARESKKIPPQPANGNYGGPKVRDRLCQQQIHTEEAPPTTVRPVAC
jgi:hypothetical protein